MSPVESKFIWTMPPQDWFGTAAWLSFHRSGTLIPWRHVKTLHSWGAKHRSILTGSDWKGHMCWRHKKWQYGRQTKSRSLPSSFRGLKATLPFCAVFDPVHLHERKLDIWKIRFEFVANFFLIKKMSLMLVKFDEEQHILVRLTVFCYVSALRRRENV